MIDIHSHILPCIDDGARDIKEAIDMLKLAIDQGVTTQVLTPHIHIGRFNNTKEIIEQHFLKFQEQVDNANLPITLRLGAECRIAPEMMKLVSQNAIPWLGEHQGKKTFLLEFPRTEIPLGSDNLIRWLLVKKVLPIIVHPERNITFLKNRDKLETFIELGCPLQITASSLTGKFGREVQKMCEKLLEQGKVSAIASDCHNLKGRAPDLAKGVSKAVELIGKDKSTELVNSKPQQFLS